MAPMVERTYIMITNVLPIAPLINAEYAGIQSDWLDKLRDIISHINANIDNINNLQSQTSGSAGDLLELSNKLDTLSATVTTIGDKVTSQGSDIVSLKGDVNAINDTLSTVQSTISDHATQLASIDTKITSINNEITTINTAITGINTAISNLDTEIDDLTTRTTDLESLTAQHGTQIGTLQSAVDKLMDDMTAAETDIANLKTVQATHTGHIASIMSDISNLTTAVTALEKELNTVNQTLSDRLETLQQAVATNSSTIAAIQLQINHLQEDISELRTAVQTNVTDISSLKSKVDIINDDLDDLTNDVSVNTQAISRLDTESTHLLTEVSNLDTRITAVEKIIGNLQPGEIPSFSESGTEGQVWTKGADSKSTGAWSDPAVSVNDIDDVKSQILDVSESVQDLESKFTSTGTQGQVWTKGAVASSEGEWVDIPPSYKFYLNPDRQFIIPEGWKIIPNVPYRIKVTLSNITIDFALTAAASPVLFARGGANSDIYKFEISHIQGIQFTGIFSANQITDFPSIINVKLFNFMDGGEPGQVWTKNNDSTLPGVWGDIPDQLELFKNSGTQGQVWTKGAANDVGVWESLPAMYKWNSNIDSEFYAIENWEKDHLYPLSLTVSVGSQSLHLSVNGYGSYPYIFNSGNVHIYYLTPEGLQLRGIYSTDTVINFPTITSVTYVKTVMPINDFTTGGTDGQVWTKGDGTTNKPLKGYWSSIVLPRTQYDGLSPVIVTAASSARAFSFVLNTQYYSIVGHDLNILGGVYSIVCSFSHRTCIAVFNANYTSSIDDIIFNLQYVIWLTDPMDITSINVTKIS